MSLASRLRAQLYGTTSPSHVVPLQPVAIPEEAPAAPPRVRRIDATTPDVTNTSSSYKAGEPFSILSRQISTVVIGEDFKEVMKDDRHNQNYVHVSDLSKMCPRAYTLAVKHKANHFKRDFLTISSKSATAIVRTMGLSSEAHIRNQFIKAFPSQVYGIWKCVCGNRLVGTRSEVECKDCQSNFRYVEHVVFDHTRRISGSPDMILIEGDCFLFVELKSINAKDFANLTAPSPEHLVQVAMYRDFAIASGMKVSKYVVVLYASKDFIVGKPVYKEYLIDTEDVGFQFVRTTQAIMYERAEKLRDSLAGNFLPERLEGCSSITEPRAAACPMCVNCFST